MKKPFTWDQYSDQPSIIRDRSFKKMMRRRELFSLIKTILISLVVLPISFLLMSFTKRRDINSSEFFGMSINLDEHTTLSKELIEELGVESILIRFPLWEMKRIEEYKEFIESFKEKKILINIMQDREHIEDLELLKSDLQKVFKEFTPYTKSFQIGTTINRAKWGFFSVNEYLKFYEVAYKLKSEFNNLELVGSNVIDFEYHFTAHTLFNFTKIKYDILGTLLYVDRRGAPEKTQMGFNLINKIKLLSSMVMLSPKVKNRVYITETNYPISGTAPYAPTSEYECVSEEDYANYMERYFLLAFATQRVEKVFWHQLIASGYGLIDVRDGERKREAYKAFKNMYTHLKDAKFVKFNTCVNYYTLGCDTPRGKLFVQWGEKPIYRYESEKS
ncbi:MAG: glycosyl hydrolase [Helicobacteraceae bacterium]|nr:glycosyl hydrolase [Helicobacteraceae bacterium]